MRNTIVTGVQDFLRAHKATFYRAQERRAGTPLPRLHGARVLRLRALLRARRLHRADAGAVRRPGRAAIYRRHHRRLQGRHADAPNLRPTPCRLALEPRSADARTASTLCVTPFFHVYGLTVGMNAASTAAVTMLLLPRFIVADMLGADPQVPAPRFPRRAHDVSGAGQPSRYQADRLRLPGGLHQRLGAAARREVQDAFERATGGHVVEGYGLTEAVAGDA